LMSRVDPFEVLGAATSIIANLKYAKIDCLSEEAAGGVIASCATDIWEAASNYASLAKIVAGAMNGSSARRCDARMLQIMSEIADIYTYSWATRAGDCRAEQDTPGLCFVDVTSATSSFTIAAQHLLSAASYCGDNFKEEVMQEYPAFANATEVLMTAQQRAVLATAPGAAAAFNATDLASLVGPVITLVARGADIALEATQDSSNVPGIAFLKRAFPIYAARLNPSLV